MPEVVLVSIIIFILLFLYLGHKHHVADWGGFFINVIDGWIRIYCRIYHGFVYQPVPVSDRGPTLIACNHLSGLDPFLIVAACEHPIRFMIAQEEYERFGLQWLFRAAGCIPVIRSGRVETAFKSCLKALHNNEVVALFPEGGINRTDRPLRKLKPGIIKLAKLAKTPITALRVEGMRAQGHVITPFLLPAQCRLYVLPKLDCTDKTDEDALVELGLFLSLKA